MLWHKLLCTAWAGNVRVIISLRRKYSDVLLMEIVEGHNRDGLLL